MKDQYGWAAGNVSGQYKIPFNKLFLKFLAAF